jgi:hypothetical protein
LHVTLKGDAMGGRVQSGGAEELKRYLQGRGMTDVRVEKITPGIEDCFIQQMRPAGRLAAGEN